VVTFGRQHVKDGWLRFVPKKTRYRRATLSEKPFLPELERIVAQSSTGDLTFLVTAHGKPFTAAGFGHWFRDRCDEAGLPKCTAHGLRKAGAHASGGSWGNRPSTDGNVRLDNLAPSDRLYGGGRPKEDGCRRDEASGNGTDG